MMSLPAQTGANIGVNPCVLTRDLVSESVQAAHLLEQRLKLTVGDGRHDTPKLLPAARRLDVLTTDV